MPRVQMYGDPEAVAKKAAEKVRDEISRKLDEALEGAIRILDAARNRALTKLEREIGSLLREAEEKVRAERATREAELRVTELNTRNEWIEKAVQEALRRLRGYVGEDTYARFMRELLRQAAEAMKEVSNEAIIYPTEPDRDLLSKLVSEEQLPVRVSIAGETVEGHGGFILASPDGKVRLDYRLEAVLSETIEEAREAAARALFS